jgi:phosphoribosylamine--glycine ligase
MKILVIDPCCLLLDLCIRARDDGHQVKWWIPRAPNGEKSLIGDGFFEKVSDWEPWKKWADLIISGDNSKYSREIHPLFASGYPVFGANGKAAELELDRGLGQEVCYQYGIETIPYVILDSWEDAIKHVEKTLGTFVSKPWGGTADKALSYVAQSPEDMIFKLGKWASKGKLKGQLMLQERVKGIEMAVGGWFGPGGFSKNLCENWEEKKFMNEGLGQNTGEQGTILRYVTESKLFMETLEPVTDYLHKISYVGYVDMNTMVVGRKPAAPLEFTMRFGYPLREIQTALHKGDSVEWMLDLLEGRDTLKVSDEVAVGVVLSHGTYPNARPDDPANDGFPMYGITSGLERHVHWTEMQWGKAPVRLGDKIKMVDMPLTAGSYLATVTGTGKTVSDAQEAAYGRIWKLKPPTNRMFRTDIGDRLEEEIPELQKNGYALGMKY